MKIDQNGLAYIANATTELRGEISEKNNTNIFVKIAIDTVKISNEAKQAFEKENEFSEDNNMMIRIGGGGGGKIPP